MRLSIPTSSLKVNNSLHFGLLAANLYLPSNIHVLGPYYEVARVHAWLLALVELITIQFDVVLACLSEVDGLPSELALRVVHAVEFELRFLSLCVESSDRWMMRYLFSKELKILVFIFIGFSQEWIERFHYSFLIERVATYDESCYKRHPLNCIFI